jgi:hypothetical protein
MPSVQRASGGAPLESLGATREAKRSAATAPYSFEDVVAVALSVSGDGAVLVFEVQDATSGDCVAWRAVPAIDVANGTQTSHGNLRPLAASASTPCSFVASTQGNTH